MSSHEEGKDRAGLRTRIAHWRRSGRKKIAVNARKMRGP